MIQIIRKFFSSKLGIGVTLAFLGVIAIAFASSDLANVGTGGFGGLSGGDRAAVVGDRRITTAELSMSADSALDQARQRDPTMTMQAFLGQGGMEQVLDQLLARTALGEYGRQHGLRAGDRLIDSEILQIPAFRGPGGNFDQNAFRAAISQRGLTEQAVREDLAMGIFGRQLLTPAALSPRIPDGFARRYASLLRERREGAIATLPSIAYAPQGDPTQSQLTEYYTENRTNFIRPERRVLRFVSFGQEALGDIAPPTDAQIAERFRRNSAQYAASESRRFTQLVVPTEAAAQAIVNEVNAGKPLEQAAREKGLATSPLGPVTQPDFTSMSSAAVAQAAFGAAEGALSRPARGSLGWYVLQVNEIDTRAARTLEQARGEIAEALTVELRQAALSDLTARIEQELDEGRNLGEIAEELGLEVSRTEPALADGRIYNRPQGTLPPQLAPVLSVAFEMEENEPQLAETVPGRQFLIFDVADITPSAAAPLAEIREQVVDRWRRDEGAEAARAAADRVMERLRGGATLEAALQAEERELPGLERLNVTRDEIAQSGQVPSVLALFFSMAEGTTKRLEAPQSNGWFVVQLDEIDAPQIAADDPLVTATVGQLGTVAGDEYIDQFARAIQAELGVERNQEAIDALVAQLTGQSN